MRKVFLVLASVFALGSANAQTSFGIHADGILASQSIKAAGFKISTGDRFSWKAGLVANVPATEQISFMPQLNLVSKGSKFAFEDTKTEIKLTYLELPLNFVFNSSGFFGGIGPVLSFGLGGKEKATYGTEVMEQDVKFDGKDADGTDEFSHYKGFEFGGNLIAGYKLESGLFFNAHYNFGLSNISPSPSSEGTAKNNYFGFGIGYFFGGGSK